MRTYRRRRRKPCAEKALRQVERGRLPECFRCDHPVVVHAFDDEGRRVCTRGAGRVSCHDCARVQASMPEFVRAVFLLGQTWQLPARADTWRPLVLT